MRHFKIDRFQGSTTLRLRDFRDAPLQSESTGRLLVLGSSHARLAGGRVATSVSNADCRMRELKRNICIVVNHASQTFRPWHTRMLSAQKATPIWKRFLRNKNGRNTIPLCSSCCFRKPTCRRSSCARRKRMCKLRPAQFPPPSAAHPLACLPWG